MIRNHETEAEGLVDQYMNLAIELGLPGEDLATRDKKAHQWQHKVGS